MPRLTSGLTHRERLEVLQSIDQIKSEESSREQKVLRLYRNMIVRECQGSGIGIKVQLADNAHSAVP